jgi:GntR family transcriptional regulator, transcriptional repressor for pyruvate dehydrogenase complex
MAFQAVERRPVYHQVAAQLREAILSGELASGSELPSERELGERFGVGRTTVREALRALQAQGLVVSGAATAPLRVVHPEALSAGPARDALVHLLRLGQVPLSDLVELRCVLEGTAVAAVARHHSDDDLAVLVRGVDTMRAALDDVRAFEQADVRFHLALAAASGNEAVHLVMLAVRDSIGSHLLDALQADPESATTLQQLLAEHEQLLAAIQRRDADEARRLVEAHVAGFYARLASR